MVFGRNSEPPVGTAASESPSLSERARYRAGAQGVVTPLLVEDICCNSRLQVPRMREISELCSRAEHLRSEAMMGNASSK